MSFWYYLTEMKDIMVSEIVEVLGGESWWKVTVGHENDGQCLAIGVNFVCAGLFESGNFMKVWTSREN